MLTRSLLAHTSEETCKALLEHGAHVVILGRSREKADEAMQRLAPAVEKGGKQAKVEFIECDLGDLTSVRKAADELWNKVEKLDVLFVRPSGFAGPVPFDSLTYP